MDKYTVWHNPRCGNSRGTIELLKERGIEPDIKLYLENVPSEDELKNVARLLNKKPIEFTRTKEKAFKEANLRKDSSDEEIIKAMKKYPILIQRPIVIKDNKTAVISRPPETVLDFI